EDNFIPLESQSQANTPVTPSEPEGSKGKGKRHSEGLITAKKWTPIATQKSRKPRNSASIQGKPTLITFTGKITIINPVITYKETLASKGTNQSTEKACPEPEDLEEDTLDTVVDEDWKDMDQVLQLHQLLKDLFQWSMDNKRFNLESHWEDLGASCQKICLKEIDFKDLMIITKGWNPTRQFRLLEGRAKRIRENQATIQAIEEQLTQTGNTQIPSGSQGEGQISSPVASHHSETNRSVAKSHHYSHSQEVSRRRQGHKGKKQDLFSPKAERVRPSYQENVGLGEGSTQEPEVVLNHSRISSPLNRNITPTQIEHNTVSPESNLNSDALWLQMSQFSEQTQKQFAELEASHERMKALTASMDKILKTLQEGHAQLSKASEETNRRLNLVFEEKHLRKRDRDCLDQDINKLFNVYHNMKPQPQGHFMDNPYYQDDIKPDAMLVSKARSPSQYQDQDNMSYTEKEALDQLPEASTWPKFSGTEEYDHMELIYYIDGLFIDVPRIPD
ncbi:hypothetical protein O181_120834, partial [Austropuccinia psidii MF-1]|nr:hypothetical protein [Austropuccinia psidii MF-1]